MVVLYYFGADESEGRCIFSSQCNGYILGWRVRVDLI
jgi:hypothetical protein